MRNYLLFRLYGPMASWGGIAVGEYRPTYGHPSKSAVLGLIGAAVGLQRDDEAALQALAHAYRFAVRIDNPGNLLRDYHTVQVPPSGAGKNKRRFATRKDELAMPKENLNTILSTRDYRCDALYTACIWIEQNRPPYTLNDLQDRLCRPTYILYLGRKSCPVSLPLQPQIISAETARQAFLEVKFLDQEDMAYLPSAKTITVYWEGINDEGFIKEHSITRRDALLSRKRWQFADRHEHYASIDTMDKE